MFRKYEKTSRIQNSAIKVSGKQTLSSKETQALLTGKIIVEEKIDGANTGIIGGKKDKPFSLQKRGSLIDISEHPQFGRFKAWTMHKYSDLMKVKYPYIVYGEFMWATHHIYYDSLPDWFICFDIWNGKEYVNRKEKEKICSDLNVEVVHLLFEGYIDSVNDVVQYVYGPSAYSSDHDREGVQIKNYKKQMRGKIVNPAFVKEVDEDGTHWRTYWNPRKVNKLKNE